MNSLTKEQVARVVAMHHGQLCHVDAGQFPEQVLPVIGAYPSKVLLGEYSIQITETVDCKLLLTPLSAISDEDAIYSVFKGDLQPPFEVFKVYSQAPGTWVSVKTRRKYYDDELKFNDDGYYYEEQFVTFYSLKDWQSQYLIQKGYAVPLFIEPGHPDNGKDAIELGIAIAKATGETINQNNK